MTKPARPNHKLSTLVTGLALILALGLGLALATGFLHVPAAYAAGTAAITTTRADLQVAFTAAATDDPRRTPDPGLGEHLGRCTARVLSAAAVAFNVYNAYPGYTCTLTLRLQNRGQTAVRLGEVRYMVPDGLALHGPPGIGQTTLLPGERLEQVFRLAVTAEAHESAQYTLTIQEIFTVEPTQTTLNDGSR